MPKSKKLAAPSKDEAHQPNGAEIIARYISQDEKNKQFAENAESTYFGVSLSQAIKVPSDYNRVMCLLDEIKALRKTYITDSHQHIGILESTIFKLLWMLNIDNAVLDDIAVENQEKHTAATSRGTKQRREKSS